ncbi:unnamed protein product [Allacma fusca]|uniref:BTB domain-containing protein n=1 Tax=Allacma fusca TaxID=39272 RepID=A0A8J2IYL6_9HEXA|nr:unnamed protein product [Allacma fusca]
MFRTVSQIRISHHGWGESGGLDLQITFIRIITRCVGVVEELVPNIFGKFILDVTNGGSNPYFKKLFLVHSPEKSNTIVILNNVRFTDLENVLQFVYAGQVNVNQSDLSSFLQTGELLQIEGLASCSDSADEKPTGSSSTPKDHSLNVPSTSRGSTSAVAENPKRQSSPVHTPSPQGLLPAIRVGSKRFRSDDSSEISHPKSTHIGASTQVKSQDDCLDSETPIIQIRSAANLMELDPLQDNNDVSYSEGKQDPEELEETEVNFGVLKAESIEVIDVEEKDDASNLVQDMNQISDLLEDVESVSHHDILPTSCLSLPQTSSTTDSLYDAPQTRVPNRDAGSNQIRATLNYPTVPEIGFEINTEVADYVTYIGHRSNQPNAKKFRRQYKVSCNLCGKILHCNEAHLRAIRTHLTEHGIEKLPKTTPSVSLGRVFVHPIPRCS